MRTRIRDRVRHPAAPASGPRPAGIDEELRAASDRQARRVRRLKVNAVAWAVGTVVLTTLWVVSQWRANGALESFGHEGEPGQWNPTLWGLGVGIWSMIVGIVALRVHFERPPTAAEVELEAARITPTAGADVRPVALSRLEGVRRLQFHVAAWALGMVIWTPLWALIEWQDNGAFERFSGDSQPGSWEPWILYGGAIWAGVIGLIALRVYVERRRSGSTERPA